MTYECDIKYFVILNIFSKNTISHLSRPHNNFVLKIFIFIETLKKIPLYSRQINVKSHKIWIINYSTVSIKFHHKLHSQKQSC